MFGLKKKDSAEKLLARQIYGSILAQSREAVFYEDFAVPDSFDGRFDMVLFHASFVFYALERLSDGAEQGDVAHIQAISQHLFDIMFKDFEDALRETGVGDLSVPKHMRRMMKAFNGRLHVYRDAIMAQDAEMMRQALQRNVYATIDQEEITDAQLGSMTEYAFGLKSHIESLSLSELCHNDTPLFCKKETLK